MKHTLLTFLFLSLAPALIAQNITRYIAIDNVCAWPNLTLLPDGSINARFSASPATARSPVRRNAGTVLTVRSGHAAGSRLRMKKTPIA